MQQSSIIAYPQRVISHFILAMFLVGQKTASTERAPFIAALNASNREVHSSNNFIAEMT